MNLYVCLFGGVGRGGHLSEIAKHIKEYDGRQSTKEAQDLNLGSSTERTRVQLHLAAVR